MHRAPAKKEDTAYYTREIEIISGKKVKEEI
jgi:hypothetical protein